jgi:FlaA1/EpsC-like NDP-sugar epimerase
MFPHFWEIIGRSSSLFEKDIMANEPQLTNLVAENNFLVLGGAGSIGQAVVKELFKRNPKKLHVVDISENNLVELVRDLRSSLGYIKGEFKSFALDIGSDEYEAYINQEETFDYVLNLSALKHVRSEKDPFTLMRMIQVNILNTDKTVAQSIAKGAKKYFCVSTDKAANPVNMMGASKRIMELFLMKRSNEIPLSTARFANVAFSDGSLLHGFIQRMQKMQPIVAPNDIKRYFVTPEEAGQLCLLSTLLGENRDIFFPKLTEDLNLISFADIAVAFLADRGYKAYECSSEDEARAKVTELSAKGYWPCLFTKSDTTGEKAFEEFYMENESVNWDRFERLGIVKNDANYHEEQLLNFEQKILELKAVKAWNKDQILALFQELLPEFDHLETGKYLDGKM